jgi:High potential iron-sulfur protein
MTGKDRTAAMAEDSRSIARRTVMLGTVMRAALAGAAFRLPLGPAVARAAPPKMTQQEARYQDRPNEWQSCAACTLFRPPSSCTVVDGAVSANGWCAAFDMGD